MTHSPLHIESIGHGKDIVMLHGWGMNSGVFTPLQSELAHFRVHYVDLPGYGYSQSKSGNINEWVKMIAENTPKNSVWLGWSLGGLVAKTAALHHPEHVKALVTVASSPYFVAEPQNQWPGIDAKVLTTFANQLNLDVKTVIERFLAIQAMGSETAKRDIKLLKEHVLSRPLPDKAALAQGLQFLQHVDLREQLEHISQPWLRMWGRLDGLVPRHLPPKMPRHHGDVTDHVIKKASHAPFFSHPQEFSEALLNWLKNL
ncbi:pimeloyl-ACP methyl ester esterase BioH [Shewanella sp. 202IG2-18]|uniref:pimeloyl-ACP methyl ester esterase BioH n=1 Tax=Parashewanella hymeniacidonis TaxID=2807618 RepID=UPI0019619B47|nr:pimeloyl-ACP methyl ester esterase BioH [Parashewanella hymeniacidonis]MBM7071158.1 pimeloyl-ACP methyl ester esterase BioH [Parashewanella hymeniacidonis]